MAIMCSDFDIVIVRKFAADLHSIRPFVLQLMGTIAVASFLKIPHEGDRFRSPLSPYIQCCMWF